MTEPPGAAPDRDEPVEISDEDEERSARIANLFDIRRIIGAVFCVYAVVLIITGLAGTHEIKTKAAGVNIDLWTGLGMLVFGVLMLIWAFARPVQPDPPEHRGRGSGRIRRAPAT